MEADQGEVVNVVHGKNKDKSTLIFKIMILLVLRICLASHKNFSKIIITS